MFNTPTLNSSICTKNDINRILIQQDEPYIVADCINYNHHYSRININRSKPYYSASVPANFITPYIRLRIWHTIITKCHLLYGSHSDQCPFSEFTSTFLETIISGANFVTHIHMLLALHITYNLKVVEKLLCLFILFKKKKNIQRFSCCTHLADQ